MVNSSEYWYINQQRSKVQSYVIQLENWVRQNCTHFHWTIHYFSTRCEYQVSRICFWHSCDSSQLNHLIQMFKVNKEITFMINIQIVCPKRQFVCICHAAAIAFDVISLSIMQWITLLKNEERSIYRINKDEPYFVTQMCRKKNSATLCSLVRIFHRDTSHWVDFVLVK